MRGRDTGKPGTGLHLPRDRAFTPSDPVPFEHVWAPLLRTARRRVRRAVGRRAHERLTGAAHAGLERVLLTRAGDLAARTLYRAFVTARDARGPGAPGAYAAFVRAQLGGGMDALLAAHPVLARLLTTLAGDWADATAELLARLDADAPSLSAALNGGRALGPVVGVHAGLSDPHAGGRQVAVLYPAGGPPVVYKPRALAPDVAYAALVDWLDGALPAGAPRPRALRVLDRGTHGWAEYAAPTPGADGAARRRYYERAGAVLCLAYVLRAGDLHAGNVVADGEHPVLIDLETLCGPVPAEGAHGPAGLEWSVLDTALLPQVCVAGDGTGAADGGIALAGDAGRAMQPTAADVAGWMHVNTDAMHWGVPPRGTPPPPHVPDLAPNGGAGDGAAANAAAVARGFRRTYDALRARRADLLAHDGPLASVAGGSTRVLVRATSVYDVLLRRTAHPSLLRHPAARAEELGVLRAAAARRAPARPALWPALDAECVAMERLDVPHFTVPTLGTGLHATGGGEVVPGYAAVSGYEAVRRTVATLDGGGLRRQLHHIRAAAVADRHRRAWPGGTTGATHADGALAPDAALDEVARLAALLRALAVRPDSDRAVWYAQDMAGGQRRLAGAGHSLESGQAGIALFFAAHAHVLAARGAVAAADEAAAWARLAAHSTCAAARRGGAGQPGFATGWGGVAYALACVACLTHDAEALASARGALDRVGPPRPRAGADVFAGAAGAVLGALAVHAVAGDDGALAHAAAWGDSLLADRRWTAAPGGFGHGRAGIAAALLRLAARTGDDRYAPSRALAALADAPADDDEPPSVAGGWCRGAPGIALARAAALASGRGASAERTIWGAALADAAARSGADARAPWTFCCGALARVDLLLVAAASLGRASLAHEAAVLAGRLVASARRRQSYAFPAHAEALVPGLLRGLAGTGYALLRVAAPGTLPSVLLADVPAGAAAVREHYPVERGL